jgi:hypothetical protein
MQEQMQKLLMKLKYYSEKAEITEHNIKFIKAEIDKFQNKCKHGNFRQTDRAFKKHQYYRVMQCPDCLYTEYQNENLSNHKICSPEEPQPC